MFTILEPLPDGHRVFNKPLLFSSLHSVTGGVTQSILDSHMASTSQLPSAVMIQNEVTHLPLNSVDTPGPGAPYTCMRRCIISRKYMAVERIIIVWGRGSVQDRHSYLCE